MLQRYKKIFEMVINLQPFFGTIHSISIEKPLKHIKNNLLSEHNGDYNTIRRCKN